MDQPPAFRWTLWQHGLTPFQGCVGPQLVDDRFRGCGALGACVH